MTQSTITTEVLRGLPPAPAELDAKQIHARLGQWSYQTVKRALCALADQGDVVRTGNHKLPTYRRAS